MNPESQPVERAMNAVRSVIRALRINSRAIEQQLGISLAQLFVLQQLAERPVESLNELADKTATHQSSVSVVVRRLVDRGLVLRTTSLADRRRVLLDVTPEGRTYLERAPRTLQEDLLKGLQALSPDEQRMLAKLLDGWLHAAEIDQTEPPMLESP
jgi:DNA-binding MarR family transcriptional regulator